MELLIRLWLTAIILGLMAVAIIAVWGGFRPRYKKFGTQAMHLNGIDDYLTVPDDGKDWDFGKGDFTVTIPKEVFMPDQDEEE